MTHMIAERVIGKLGGPRAVAGMLAMSTQAVYKWTWPRERGGTGGLIPSRRQIELMVAAKQRGVILTKDDFFPKDAKDDTTV
jgi:hypothetical protein